MCTTNKANPGSWEFIHPLTTIKRRLNFFFSSVLSVLDPSAAWRLYALFLALLNSVNITYQSTWSLSDQQIVTGVKDGCELRPVSEEVIHFHFMSLSKVTFSIRLHLTILCGGDSFYFRLYLNMYINQRNISFIFLCLEFPILDYKSVINNYTL